MKRQTRHVHFILIAILMALSLASYGGLEVGQNADVANSHLQRHAKPEPELIARAEVIKVGGQIGRLDSHKPMLVD